MRATGSGDDAPGKKSHRVQRAKAGDLIVHIHPDFCIFYNPMH